MLDIPKVIYSFKSSQDITLFDTTYGATLDHKLTTVRGTRMDVFKECKEKMGTIRPWVELTLVTGEVVRGVDITDTEFESILVDSIEFYSNTVTLLTLAYHELDVIKRGL